MNESGIWSSRGLQIPGLDYPLRELTTSRTGRLTVARTDILKNAERLTVTRIDILKNAEGSKIVLKPFTPTNEQPDVLGNTTINQLAMF
jgi:hypothetical protein